jgi:hypothetical protein
MDAFALYLLAAVLLHAVCHVCTSLALVSKQVVFATRIGFLIRWAVVLSTFALTLPVLLVLCRVLARRMNHCVGRVDVDGLGWVLVVAVMHGATETVVYNRLIAIALKAVSHDANGVLLLRLVSHSNHVPITALILVGVRLCDLLGAIDVLLLLLLYVLEIHGILRLIYELGMTSELVGPLSTTDTLRLINVSS